MKHSFYILLLILLNSCAKESVVADGLDGSWNFDRYSWDANGSDTTLQANIYGNDSLGVWTFVTCNTLATTCVGTANYPGGTTESFNWQVVDEGDSLTITTSGSNSNEFSGKWGVKEQSSSILVLESKTCTVCKIKGLCTAEFFR